MSGTEARQRAQALLEAGRYEGAAEHLAPHLAKHPQDAQAWTMLARSLYHREDPDGAFWAVDEALRADPGHERAWRVRSALLSGTGRHEEAIAAAEESVRLEPDLYQAHLTLAQALSNGRLGDPRAHEAAKRAAELAPDEAEAHCTVGVISHAAGNFDAAERAYRAALAVDPRHARAHDNLAALESRSWRREGADAAAAVADPQDALLRDDLEAVAYGLVAKARWWALLCWVVGMIGAASSGIGDGDPPQPGVFAPRLVTLLLIAVLAAFWVTWFRRVVPEQLRGPLLALMRGSAPVRLVGAGCALIVLTAVAAVALPLTNPGLLVLATPAVWVAVVLFWAGQVGIRCRRSEV